MIPAEPRVRWRPRLGRPRRKTTCLTRSRVLTAARDFSFQSANLISERTRAALKAAKARGVVLGNPRLADQSAKAVARTKAEADRFANNIAPVIRDIQSSGITSHRAIARALTARGVATARGGEWTAVQVGAILQRKAE
jgi:DNA invertase Pin-like site-specific DNA recombinase